MTIERSHGDQSPVRWFADTISGKTREQPDFSDVTAIEMRIYDDKSRTTLIETLTGEKRGFDAATWFPIIDGGWSGTRYYEVVYTKDALETPVGSLEDWVQS